MRVVFAVQLLRDAGVGPGDHVALSFNRGSAAQLVYDLACLFIAAVPTSLPSRQNPDFERVANALDSRVMVADEDISLRTVRVLKVPECVTESATTSDPLEQLLDWTVNDDDRLATIIFTSGTTGAPAPIALGQRRLITGIANWISVWPAPPNPAWRTLSHLSMAHVAERVMSYYIPLLYGLEIVMVQGESVGAAACRVRPHVLFGPPSVWGELRAHDAVDSRWRDNLCVAICGGAPLSTAVRRSLREVSVDVLSAYGLTETGAPVVFADPSAPDGSIGRVIPSCEVRISTAGELECRTPAGAVGTLARRSSDGWIRTGDAASIDPAGNVYLRGRISDELVLQNGMKVSPERLELQAAGAVGAPYCCVVPTKDRTHLALVLSMPGRSPVVGPLVQADAELERAIRAAVAEVPGGHYVSEVLVAEGWALGSEAVTDSGKIKRSVVESSVRGAHAR